MISQPVIIYSVSLMMLAVIICR